MGWPLAVAQVFKLLGSAGFLGTTKPVEFGGSGLDYSYSVAMAEELVSARAVSLLYVRVPALLFHKHFHCALCAEHVTLVSL